MKKLCMVAAALLIMSTLTSCVGVNFRPPSYAYRGGSMGGKGDMITREYAVEDYTTVEINASMEVIYSATYDSKVVLDIQESLVDHIDIRSENGTLIVESERDLQPDQGKTPKLYLYNPNLQVLDISGAVHFPRGDAITGDSFQLDIGGAGSVYLDVDVNQLTVNLSGAASVELYGRADTTSLELSGVGAIEAFQLETKTANVKLGGVGSATINCSETLNATVSGTGSLSYKGDPTVNKNISGFGAVHKAD